MRRFIVLLALLAGLSHAINVTGCMNITSPGTYDLINDIQGANISAPENPTSGIACIRIHTNNVILDCHGFSVTENSTGSNRYGIMTRGNYSTIRNCVVSGYNGSGGSGIAILQNSSLTVSRRIYSPRLDNVTCFNNYYGLRTYNYDSNSGLWGTIGLILSNSTFYGNNYGVFMSSYATNFSIINNNFSNNNYSGFYTTNLASRNCLIANNTASYNRLHSNSGGFYLDGVTLNITMVNNTAEYNNGYGIYIDSMNTSLYNNTIRYNNFSGIYMDAYSNDGFLRIINNTVIGNNGTGIFPGYFDYPDVVNLTVVNNTLGSNTIGINILGCVVGTVYNNTAENNSDSGFFFTSQPAGTGRDMLNLTVDRNRAYNNSRGFVIAASPRRPYNLTFLNNTALENTKFDFYMDLMSVGPDANCSFFDIGNLTSSGGRPIMLVKNTSDIRDIEVAELVICESNGSTVTNVTIHGSDLIHNNGICLHKSGNVSLYNLSMANDYASFDLVWSHNNRFFDNTVEGSVFGVMNYYYNVGTPPYQRSSENNTFANNNMTGCDVGYYFAYNSLGGNNITSGIVRDSTQSGVIANSSRVTVDGTRFCNNNPDVKVWGSITDNLNLSYAIFDSPSCAYSNFTNLSLVDTGSPANFTINWSAQPAASPSGRFPLRGFINITRYGTTTIDRMVFNWRDDELGGMNESLFRLYRYNTSWTSVNSTPNITLNTLSLFAVNSFSIYGIFGSDSAPTVTLLSPPTWTYYYNSTQVFTFNTSDNSPILNCSLYLDTVLAASNASTNTGTPADFTRTGLTDGYHSWQVRCIDAASNTGSSPTWFVGIDTTPPDIELVSPGNGSTLPSPDVSLEYYGDDAFASTLNCSLYLDGSFEANDPDANSEDGYYFNITGLPDGTHEWYVQCDDGHWTNQSPTWEFTIDTRPPEVSLETPLHNAVLYSQDADFRFNATDNLATLMECSIYLDSSLNQTDSAVANATSTLFQVYGIEDGFHDWRVECGDGINMNSSDTRLFMVDSTPPQIELNSPNESQAFESGSVEFNFTASDNLATDINCTLLINGTSFGNALVTDGIPYLFDVAGLADGNYSWSVECSDGGNTNESDVRSFIIEAPAPTTSDEGEGSKSISVAVASSCSGNTVTVRGDGNLLPGAEVRIDGAILGDTGMLGEISFGGCGRTVDVRASKDGYLPQKIAKALIACGQCEAPPQPQNISCPCGVVVGGSCLPFMCCSDSMCRGYQRCDIPSGSIGGDCVNITGDCGYAQNHTLVPYGYECGTEPGCPSCPEGSRCQNHSCVRNDLRGPDKVVVGHNATINATENEGPCAICDVEITAPGGAVYTGKTDERGNLAIPFRTQGEYKVSLLRNGQVIKTIVIQAFPLATPVEPEKPVQTSPDDEPPWWLLILLLFVFLAIIYWRRRKKEKAVPQGGKKPAPAAPK